MRREASKQRFKVEHHENNSRYRMNSFKKMLFRQVLSLFYIQSTFSFSFYKTYRCSGTFPCRGTLKRNNIFLKFLNFQIRNAIKIMTRFLDDNFHNWLKICITGENKKRANSGSVNIYQESGSGKPINYESGRIRILP